MKVKLIVLAAAAGLATAVPSFGAQAPIVAQPLAVGTLHATTIHAGSGVMVLDRITIAPGGSFGWHTHGSPVAVIVAAGTLTVFDPAVANCAPFKVSKGQSFVEPANHVHLARNDTKTPVRVYAMFMGLSKPALATKPATAPAGCSA